MVLRRRRLLRAAAPLAGLLAAALLVWQGSTAAFTQATTAPGNAFSSGTVVLTNNTGPGGTFLQTGNARFNVAGIKPGQQQQQCVSVRSTGSLGGSLRFFTQGVTGTGLQNRLRIRVQRVALPTGTGAGTSIPANCAGYPGAGNVTLHNVFLPTLPTTYAAGNATRTLTGGVVENTAYRIRWTFVSTGTNAGDNLLQGSTAGATFVWQVQ
jgi:predicted ribosomally synthesized peptide with SipW-like signal peptide